MQKKEPDFFFFALTLALYLKVPYICRYYNLMDMKQVAVNIWRFYLEGFRGMTLGRTLWLIILVKLFIMFFILRLFFFPRFLDTPAVGEDKEGYVSNELIHRSLGSDPLAPPSGQVPE